MKHNDLHNWSIKLLQFWNIIGLGWSNVFFKYFSTQSEFYFPKIMAHLTEMKRISFKKSQFSSGLQTKPVILNVDPQTYIKCSWEPPTFVN